MIEHFDSFLQNEFSRWAGAASNRGPLRDNERKISLREWTAFLSAWQFLNVNNSNNSSVKKKQTKKKIIENKYDNDSDNEQEDNDTGNDMNENENENENSNIPFNENNQNNEINENNETDENNATDDIDGMNEWNAAAVTNLLQPNRVNNQVPVQKVRKLPRVLPIRPTRQMTIWEAKRMFSTSISRNEPPNFGTMPTLNNVNNVNNDGMASSSSSAMLKTNFFQIFNSWDTSIRKNKKNYKGDDSFGTCVVKVSL